ncbi:MAG TPA: hypothetical protein VMS86_00600 [Thermoanaerobaculia bacterium]|nr:hypothetical protein [Thermoanaerobaculia bacterium]
MRRRLAWILCFALTIVIAAAAAPTAAAQPPESTPAEEPGETESRGDPADGEGDPLAAPPPEPDLEAIERMLREDEEVLGGSGYAYDPGDRRDPFLSLLRVAEAPDLLGPRPDGVPGLLIDEIELTGVFVTARGGVAQVQAADKTKSFLIHEGDQLYDGEVLDIRFERNEVAEVVFRQDVRDPTAAKPFREVVKKLNP